MEGWVIYFNEDISLQLKKLNYKIDSNEERIAIVNEILESSPVQDFLSECTSNKTGALLEILANYICHSAAEKKAFGVPVEKEKIEDICKKDDDTIRDYCRYRSHLKELKNKPESKNMKISIDRIIGTVNDDIREVNESLFPKVQAHGDTISSREPMTVDCDYTNPNHVRYIITLPRVDALHPLYPLKEDILNIIKANSSSFTENEKTIVSYFNREGGVTITDVSEELGIPRSNVSRYVRSVSYKITEIESRLSSF